MQPLALMSSLLLLISQLALLTLQTREDIEANLPFARGFLGKGELFQTDIQVLRAFHGISHFAQKLLPVESVPAHQMHTVQADVELQRVSALNYEHSSKGEDLSCKGRWFAPAPEGSYLSYRSKPLTFFPPLLSSLPPYLSPSPLLHPQSPDCIFSAQCYMACRKGHRQLGYVSNIGNMLETLQTCFKTLFLVPLLKKVIQGMAFCT